MQTIMAILNEYGMAPGTQLTENQLEKILRKELEKNETLHWFPESKLKAVVLKSFLDVVWGICVVDTNQFKNKLATGRVRLTSPDWLLVSIGLELSNFMGEKMVEFRLEKQKVDTQLQKQFKTRLSEMKKEDKEFHLAYTFDPEQAIKKKSDKLIKTLTQEVGKLNETLLRNEMHNRLAKILLEMYRQEHRNQLTTQELI